ncbi:hypothetical protein DEU56DRAFT_975871 [Suillus clintonianus]|uniref:uncharacterized protein n=1 Tax=Suillus clintonianus TaxID=1904413 RepID=UPI001B874893|nr:uncharacterized protein DEU56DRAFT_975871 [Suillus clintonianus]KAG2156275.1 hypothetical protein DEU56DRAFT_975871 [Suillus clintonianus]
MTAFALAPSSLDPGASRPARKENRIVAFFRSRSRSRSRPRAKSTVSSSAAQSTTDVPTLPMVPASKLRISHVRSTSLAHEPGHAAHTSLSGPASQSISKPGTRTSTRPISSTTTATHSTITPLPSDSIRRRQRMSRHVYSHDYTQEEDPDHQANGDNAASQDDHDRATRSDTPSSLNQRRKLELRSIFGIALSRKSSLSNPSRKPSPGSSDRKISSSSLSQKEAENTSSRKRSFRLNSRPNTPKSIDESRVTKTSTGTIPTPSNPLPLSATPRRLSFGLNSSSRTHTPMTSSGHLPLALPSRHKRQSVGSHDTAHDSAVALHDDHSDSALTSSSHIDTRSNSKTSASTLSHFGKSRKGKEQERDTSSSKMRSQTRKTSRTDDSRPGIFGSLSEETSPIVTISPPPPQSDSRGKYDLGGLVVSLLPTVESMAEEDAAEQRPLIRAPQARPAIPRIIHTPPTPQRTGELDSPVRPATTPPTLSGGQGKSREVLLSKQPITVHNELPKLHARAALPTSSDGDPAYNRMRSRFSPRLFGGKDMSRESKKQKPGGRHDPPGAVGPPRNMTSRRIQHGSFDFERPVSGLNRSSSTVNASLVKGEGLTQSGAATHRPTTLERTASSSSDHTGKSRTYAYHPTRADSPILAQLSANHTGETSVVSFSSASASAQSKSTGKSASGPGLSSSWGRASGRRTQRTSHGPFPFEPAASVPSSPLPTSSALPRSSPSPHRQEFDIPEAPAPLPPSSPLRSELGLGGGSLRDKSQSARGRVQQAREQGGEKRGKGRSLDLKLGLSWAPNRVRQEAVIPGSLLSQKQEEERNRGKDVTKVFENVLSESGFETFKKYVHRFDAHLIPLEGPRGLLARIEKLLTAASISQTEKAELLDQFARFVEGHSEV